MKLYHFPLSGHAHRARLFLSLLNVEAEIVDVDLANGEHKSAPYLALNSFGQVPVLVDGDTVISDSNAILVYVAKKFGRSDWLPEAPAAAARVQRWLSVAAGELAAGPGAARLITVFGADFDPEKTIAKAHAILKLIDSELEGRNWITGSAQPTIADVALYSYIVNAPEGNVDLSSYNRVNAWLDRIEKLEGFAPFQTTEIGLRKAA
ncbi:Glutathione S-transferase, N-terminal:Glutathione S-transferase, C-terminal [Erythrobacter sp. NAP1]|uniref:glutathione S-transferase family protein n=1 Tax=Erythrobacter sp. NAP1 TaxID=237727 RepID=UPI0000685252|nr:glutathione S-transferase [Erythrobacter sp. NAP1]EAQ27674.1 Glutathione S-transferase, N-terminal:Glutathione S-transferase, C-terminal [Erythrobacter sp. NAP1]